MLIQSYWVTLPQEVRTKLREVFSINRSQPTEVKNNMVISDGSNETDLSVVTLEALQGFVGSQEASWEALWVKALDKVDRLLKGIVEVEPVGAVEEVKPVKKSKKLGKSK